MDGLMQLLPFVPKTVRPETSGQMVSRLLTKLKENPKESILSAENQAEMRTLEAREMMDGARYFRAWKRQGGELDSQGYE